MHIPHTCSLDSFDRENDCCTPCQWHDMTLTLSRMNGLLFQAHMEFDLAVGRTHPDGPPTEEQLAAMRIEAVRDLADVLSEIAAGAVYLLREVPDLSDHVAAYLTEEQREVFKENLNLVKTAFVAIPKEEDGDGEDPPLPKDLSFGYH